MFKRNPDAKAWQEYQLRATQTSQVCMYIFQNHACPPEDGAEKIDLNNDENRSSLVDNIIAQIIEMNIASLYEEDRTQAILDMAQNITSGLTVSERDASSGLTAAEREAGLIIVNLNMIDLLTRHYYEVYPKSKLMLKLINQLAKICPAGMRVIFTDDLPVEVRRAFPHFSSMFEHNRANF